ncbi:2-oxoglutarate dehydrogenase E1 component [Persicimonas caeni]|uniref:2-oxoglutarate dehydrogenase E1 component n=1 Tax=Persicimonas caeni TaxID=2292766 RepID=UPI001C9AE6BA|nr:2-oxoglutarate dehydrogenase E1 component [Persicimonas caeni]
MTDQPSEKTEFTGDNLTYIEQLYAQYLDDPSSVDPSWKPVFDEYLADRGAAKQKPSFRPRTIFRSGTTTTNGNSNGEAVYVDKVHNTTVGAPGRTEGFAARIEALVRAYRLHGHLIAKIDPLDRSRPPAPPELDPATYGFSDSDLDTPVRCEPLFGSNETSSLREVLERLKQLYCDGIAVEYQDMPVSRSRSWLREQIEKNSYASIDGADEKKRILQRLIEADSFESFLHKKYVGAKRFSITGGDTLIPMLDAMLNELGRLGAEEIIFGMAHRGRLNVLHNIMGKPADAMLSEFERSPEPEEYIGSSDVKYHMGYSSDFETTSGRNLHLSLCFNPSHLEFVNPVVQGRARAKQHRRGDALAREEIVPVLMHGDAAFSGQGIVTESLNLSRLDAYNVGGTIHIVINNQIGFTTEPKDGRSTTYATDVAKMLSVPIFHVNGDDPEACVRVMKLAAKYRQMFQEDVIIDLVCYREYGHNEGDEPRYTQPVMYQRIEGLAPVRKKYTQELLEEGVIDQEEADRRWDERMEMYSRTFEKVHTSPKKKTVDTMNGLWEPYEGGDVDATAEVETAVARERLEELGTLLSEVPDDFTPHRTLKRLLKTRKEMATGNKPLDWGMGEALAYATLLTDNHSIRMSGQDAIRGTFSHRHAAVFDAETGLDYWPARHLQDEQGELEVYNSLLSEAAVVGFEYGYSLDYPDGLTIWEAQFGDFSNGAQVIMDQFISSGEDKWKRLSGLVMLLPHGYEGQGPEHSSARLERYLQLCAEDNMFVCNPTNPAQYFHMMRRHMMRAVRKPLIVMTPKSLLRHRDATSTLEDLSEGSFQPILGETDERVDPKKAKRVILCSGKVYYDLASYRAENEHFDTAILRVEQLFPLREAKLEEALAKFSNREEVVWVQEEPKNMGAWTYIFPRLLDVLGPEHMPSYVGRRASASPATGSPEAHDIEQATLVREAFGD